MNSRFFTFLATTFVVASLFGQSSGLPPIIDRELLFGDPEISGAQLSPDGKYIAFQKPWQGTRNVWVKKTEEPFTAARLITAEKKRPLAGYLWTRDSKYVVFVKDNDGDENFNIYGVDPAAATGTEAPPARDLTKVKGAQVQLYAAPKAEPGILYIGLNDRDKSWHDLYRLNVATGEKTLVRKNTEQVARWVFDWKGQLRLATRSADNGDNEILRVDEKGFTPIYSCSMLEDCSPVAFHKDGARVYLETNKGALNLSELQLLEVATGKTATVESDPLKRVDFGSAAFSEVTDKLVMTTYIDEKPRHYFKDKAFEADYKWLQSKLPGRELSFASSSADENLWIIGSNSDVEPGETYLYDRKKKTLALQYKIREKLPREALSPMKPVKYKSSDGLEIPAYLTLPKGLAAKGLPVLIFPHGGPWARDFWGFNGFAQFFANRGYAVLSPNFRGSTGYGKSFLNAGNGEWGKKMQDDLTWGVKYLIAEGIADPKRVGIIGGSYGGYATLAGVAFTPEVYRAAVDIVGPSNLNTLLDAIPPYWESFRKVMYGRMADPNTPEGKAWLKERSPLTSAEKIRTPLLVVQGANDPRVNKAEAEQIVIALRDRKFPVEYLLADDEGHGFARPVNNMAMFYAIEKFLAKHMDGRYQDGATPAVAKRLTELTVDPATVKLAPKLSTAGAAAPKPGAPSLASFQYTAKISVQGQEIPVKMTTVITEKNGDYEASEKMETMMGEVKDLTVLEKGSLGVKSRQVEQGPAKIEVAYADKKAAGKMAMNGQERPIAGELSGTVFADGAGALQSVAALPLATGYTASYMHFDIQRAKEKPYILKVVGEESVKVAAGTFDAWKVEIAPADGSASPNVVWVDKAQKKAVKFSSVLANLPGATMVGELEK